MFQINQIDWMGSDHYLIIVALGVISICIVSFILTKYQSKFITEYVVSWMPNIIRGRRISTSKTPPRSFSPEKNVPSNTPSAVDKKDVFPPSCRDSLAKIVDGLPSASKGRLRHGPIDQTEFKKNLIPLVADYRECGPTTYTPTEISIDEVKALGDFPNYAELSGVPLPQAYGGFKLENAIPRPYRPFRWAYHQTMSLTKMETDWWLELEQNYIVRIAEREKLFEDHRKEVLDYLPGSELGCKEIMENALQFYCARYPQYFSLSFTFSEGHVFLNKILKTKTVINKMHPLHVLLHNVPEDFAIMIRDPEDGCYYFRAGLLCSSLGWNVATKIGMQLKEIHSPIPDYKEKMEFSMDRYFAKLPTSRPIQRGSWGLEVDQPIFMPPNDPHERYRLSQLAGLPLSRVHLRVDWQTLRRLPLSGAIVFNFKALFTPLAALRREPYIPALLATILRHGKESIMRYKNTWHVEHVALPALEAWAEEQVEQGVVEKGWKVRTLEESPWFPGWEEMWRRQQGF